MLEIVHYNRDLDVQHSPLLEYYDPDEDVWRFSAKLRSGRAGAGVIVLPDLPVDNVKLEPSP